MSPKAVIGASLGVSALALAVPRVMALPAGAALAGKATAQQCGGSAKRVARGRVSFSFSCGNQDVTGFEVRANRALHQVYDPSAAFECGRRSSRAFDCGDIHSGAGPIGSGVATVSEPLCRPRAHLLIRITPTLDFESRSRPAFMLRGPC
jgi:hypothetical protein